MVTKPYLNVYFRENHAIHFFLTLMPLLPTPFLNLHPKLYVFIPLSISIHKTFTFFVSLRSRLMLVAVGVFFTTSFYEMEIKA